jgi:DNA adenine methylase
MNHSAFRRTPLASHHPPSLRAIASSRSGRPLLKWPGGKRQLLPLFRGFYPERVERYIEPFAGSAAVFFDLLQRGTLDGAAVELTDNNADLIGCYQVVRDTPEAVIAVLNRFDRRHARQGGACYYAIRERFNAERRKRPSRASDGYTPELAAMVIYLNRTGFNGLFRLNAKGDFNVPAGRYARPRICEPELVHSVSAALRREGVQLRHCAYEESVEGARKGDFVYLDPPYEPLSPTSSFNAYTAARFSTHDQRRLCEVVVELARRGCRIMLSNSSARSIAVMYREAARVSGSGLRLWQLPARRAINSRPSLRGAVSELLFTNLPLRVPAPTVIDLS